MFGASVAMTQGQEDQNWKGIEWMPPNGFFQPTYFGWGRNMEWYRNKLILITDQSLKSDE